MNKYDPWGPISSHLFSINNSDLVEDLIGRTGVLTLSSDRSTHKERIREYKKVIQIVYDDLPDDEKGRFTQIVLKGLLDINDSIKKKLIDSLNDIGWNVNDNGALTTQDALLSEQFFPPGTPYDAYVAIREIIEKSTSNAMIIDPYMGSTIFATLSTISAPKFSVQLLTTSKNLKPDFQVEASKFQAQYKTVRLDVRTTTDFHDRFIVIDKTNYYHVGASVKDAGKRAFLISRLQDKPIISAIDQYIIQVWDNAKVVL